MRRNFLCKLAAGLVVSALPLIASAQACPTKPIKVIVPATPDGTPDILMRALAPRLQEALGKPIIIEYKPGAATNIGTDLVAKVAPDGYTLLINGLPLFASPTLFAQGTGGTGQGFTGQVQPWHARGREFGIPGDGALQS